MSKTKKELFPRLVEKLKNSPGKDALERATQDLLSSMTLAEKIGQMSGNATQLDVAIMLIRYNLKTYDSGENRRLGIPAIRFTDGPRGITVGRSTCFPAAIARGATWDPDLESRVGHVMGVEARAQGANFFAGVCVNVLRHPGWDRAQETFGEDPHLLGEMGSATIRGAKPHVMTCVKHFACNSIEESRFYVDVRIDERALREIYLPHFKKCVAAGADSVMSAYNRVNGSYCGHNRHLLTDILKNEWGFDGFVMSDFCYGVYDGKAGITAGLDVEMPWTRCYGKKLRALVEQGEVPEAAVDQAVSRVLRAKLAFALRDAADAYPPEKIACPEHTRLAYEVACKSMVLLKNENRVLPLDRTKIRRIAVLGRLACKANLGDRGSSLVRPPYAVTPLAGIRNRAGREIEVLSYTGSDPEKARQTAAKTDVTIIVAGLTGREEGEYFPRIRGGDRLDLGLGEQDRAMIKAVSGQGSPCVVVLEGGSAITMDGWKDSVDTILMAWYPGMEGGNALADILFGNVNPGGRLPVTFFESADQLFAFDKKARRVTYDHYHGFRYADFIKFRPAFYFGFGLSYTQFSWSGLRLADKALPEDGTLTARMEITNTGKRTGDEVIQLYIEPPAAEVPRPVRELKAFCRVSLNPEETRTVKLAVPVSDLAFYNAGHGRWEIAKGDYTVRVGPSADPDQLRLAKTFTVM
ncbi:MAG: glycoside hydrolase family 3 C-terminal domain-containing protein [Thermodesulfobacteriota bacterium]